MRIQMQIKAMRYTRHAATAWIVFIVSLGLSRFGDELFGASDRVLSISTLCMQLSFAAGCVLASGTAGVLAFSRAAFSR